MSLNILLKRPIASRTSCSGWLGGGAGMKDICLWSAKAVAGDVSYLDGEGFPKRWVALFPGPDPKKKRTNATYNLNCYPAKLGPQPVKLFNNLSYRLISTL
eukprot:2690880-Rhodomonas_salina.1